jgi:hypothetical protein
MLKPESLISIFLGNLFFFGFLISVFVWFWADKMYAVGMDVNLILVIPFTIISILIAAMIGTFITRKVTRGKF